MTTVNTTEDQDQIACLSCNGTGTTDACEVCGGTGGQEGQWGDYGGSGVLSKAPCRCNGTGEGPDRPCSYCQGRGRVKPKPPKESYKLTREDKKFNALVALVIILFSTYFIFVFWEVAHSNFYG